MRVAFGLLVGCGSAAVPALPPAVVPPPDAVAPALVMLDAIDDAKPAYWIDLRVAHDGCTIGDLEMTADPVMHVPLGMQVRLNVSRLADADTGPAEISFGTPRSIADGSADTIFFRADRAATYTWSCNGTPRTIAVMTERETTLAFGKQVYVHKGCASCHTIDGTARVGPTWKGAWGTKFADSDRVYDAAYVEESILKPRAYTRPGFPLTLPSFEGAITPDEIAAVTALIQSLAE